MSIRPEVESLSLFPLSRAVVPGVILKLQLFEQRYLKLVRDCMAAGKGFGVVGIKSGSESASDTKFHNFGCRVQVEDWDQLQNGLLGISVRADDRFSLGSIEQLDDGLWMGQVEWLSDKRKMPVTADYEGLKDLCESLAAHAGQAIDLNEDAASLGWAIANLLPISNEDFAHLLSEDDPLERLEILAAQIDELSMR